MDTSRYGMLSRPQGFPRETDFRSAAFAAWCSRLEGRRVGIYGTGANARHVLETEGFRPHDSALHIN